jgi:hypothetical protein
VTSRRLAPRGHPPDPERAAAPAGSQGGRSDVGGDRQGHGTRGVHPDRVDWPISAVGASRVCTAAGPLAVSCPVCHELLVLAAPATLDRLAGAIAHHLAREHA